MKSKKLSVLLCSVVMATVLAITAVACPAPNCESNAKTAYCGGGTTQTGLVHTIVYYDPFWPLGRTEAPCTYAYVDHSTYGKCNACGYIYPQGSDVFFPHSGDCAHSHAKCNDNKTPVCSSGDVLGWYF